MQIISNKAARFEKHLIVSDGVAIVEDNISIVPSPYPQIVPDWVGENDLYKLLCDDGSVVQVQYGTKANSKVNSVPETAINMPKLSQDQPKVAKIVEPVTLAK